MVSGQTLPQTALANILSLNYIQERCKFVSLSLDAPPLPKYQGCLSGASWTSSLLVAQDMGESAGFVFSQGFPWDKDAGFPFSLVSGFFGATPTSCPNTSLLEGRAKWDITINPSPWRLWRFSSHSVPSLWGGRRMRCRIRVVAVRTNTNFTVFFVSLRKIVRLLF